MLLDKFQRVHDYLRISLTDSCNFRCHYCMPDEDTPCMSNDRLMQPDEIEAIATEFVRLGVKKIRLTGGEPMVRKAFPEILHRLSQLPVELTLTTNGALLHRHLDALKVAGVRSLNISMDSLQEDLFNKIVQRNQFRQVWDNVLLALEHGFGVKINVVAMAGVNEGEINDFISLTRNMPLHVRFIEFMPFTGNQWQNEQVLTAARMLELVCAEYDIVKLLDEPHATARKYKVVGYEGTFAFITTMSDQFCGDCNRMRLTADGKMKNCLFGSEEMDILGAFRRTEPIEPLIRASLMRKHAAMGGQVPLDHTAVEADKIENRSMIKIGG
jgi:molybdenum cofactor biosynthesis protein A